MDLSTLKLVLIGDAPRPDESGGMAMGSVDGSMTKRLHSFSMCLEKHLGVQVTHPSLSSWISEGILSINYSFTNSQSKTVHHTLYWRDLVRELLEFITMSRPVLVVFLGPSTSFLKEGIRAPSISIEVPSVESFGSKALYEMELYNSNHFKKITDALKKLNYEVNWN